MLEKARAYRAKRNDPKSKKGLGELFGLLKRWYVDPQSLTPPAGGCSGRTEILLSGRDLVELDGCKGLTVYKEDEISMKIREGVLSVCGKDLELKIYRGAHIAVMGKIERILFLEEPTGKGGKDQP